MSEENNRTPQPISDEELDCATGGGIGINPLLLLASGGQGIYAQSADAGHAPVTAGVNPLYVENAHTPALTTPVVSHDVVVAHAPATTAAPLSTSPGHDYTPPPAPTPVVHASTIVPAHDNSTIVMGNSAATGMGSSLDIPSHPASQPPISSTITISGTFTPTTLPDMPKETPSVTVMTFAEPTYTTITPTVDPKRSAGFVPHVGTYSSLENAFDLQLVNDKK